MRHQAGMRQQADPGAAPPAHQPPAAMAGWPGPDPRQDAPRRTPSGLFPHRTPRRPTYREPFPARGGALTAGLIATAAWMLIFGLLGFDLVSYVWWTVLAGGVAWLVALLLARHGDRGVAAGISISTALAWSTATVAVAVRWITSGAWPLW